MNPFTLSPNPSLLFQTAGIKTALFKLRYVVRERQGLTAVLGDPGVGKSSLMRLLLGEITADLPVQVAFLPSPHYVSDFAFLKAICAEFRIPPKRSHLLQEEALQSFLFELQGQQKTAVLMIDEAQRLPGSQLEICRTLLNFETNEQKLIQVVLAAQLELRDKLKDKSKAAIRSRIFLPSVLAPLTLPEAVQMLDFRCRVVDMTNPFSEEVVKAMYDVAGGNPRELLKVAAAAHEIMKMQGVSVIPIEAIPQLAQEAALTYE